MWRVGFAVGQSLLSRPERLLSLIGEGEADPKAGSIAFISPVAKSLMGKAVGDVAGPGSQEIEILSIA